MMRDQENKSRIGQTTAVVLAFLAVLFFFKPAAAEESQPVATARPYTFRNPFVPFLPKKPIEPVAEIKEAITNATQLAVKPPDLQISGIVWNTDRPQAIINSFVVGVGDTIADVLITNITRSGVSFEYKGKRFIIDPNKNIAEPLEQIN